MLKLCHIAPLASIMVLVTIFVCYLVFGTVQLNYIDHAAKPKLVIDQDGGADDAMAIFMAILYEKYFNGPQVVALTTTHGNVGEEQTYNNTQRILNVAERRNIPIYRGSGEALISGIPSDFYFGVDGLGDNYEPKTFKAIPAKKEHAVIALINLSKKYKDKLVVVALGSLTNIALAIKIDPDFVSRLSQLYVAAGNIYSENYTEPEFNAATDPEAYDIVVKNGTPDKMTVIPFSQILTYQEISKDWRKNVLGTINTKIMLAQNSFERISFDSTSFWSLLDPSAMAIALEEKTVVEETVYSNNSIILCGKRRGINNNDYGDKDEANSRIIYRVKKEPYKEFLYKLFSSADTRKTSVN